MKENEFNNSSFLGVANLDSGCGVYAPDAESYQLFAPLFNPIIEDYHNGFKPTDKQPKVDLGDGKTSQLKDLDPEGELEKIDKIPPCLCHEFRLTTFANNSKSRKKSFEVKKATKEWDLLDIQQEDKDGFSQSINFDPID